MDYDQYKLEASEFKKAMKEAELSPEDARLLQTHFLIKVLDEIDVSLRTIVNILEKRQA